MSIKVPTLSSTGWVEDVAHKADRLFAYYLTSEHSQSYLYYNNITSLTYHIQQYGSRPLLLQENIERDLRRMLMEYFDNVDLTIKVDEAAQGDPERINITFDCRVTQDGKRYSLGRLVRATQSKVIEFMEINNGARTGI